MDALDRLQRVMRQPRSRVRRPAVVGARWYRVLVPALVALVGAGTLVVLALAAAVLFGLMPYPGR